MGLDYGCGNTQTTQVDPRSISSIPRFTIPSRGSIMLEEEPEHDSSAELATKALQEPTSGGQPSLYSIMNVNRTGSPSMCMSRLFDTLTEVEDAASETFPSIEWPEDPHSTEAVKSVPVSEPPTESRSSSSHRNGGGDSPANKRRRSYEELQYALRQRISAFATQLQPRQDNRRKASHECAQQHSHHQGRRRSNLPNETELPRIGEDTCFEVAVALD